MPRKLGDKFTGKVRQAFLDELRRTGHIYHACRVAGVCYETMKKYREGGHAEDPIFEAEYQQAMGDYIGVLKDEAQRRAVEGWAERPVVDKDGNVCGEVRKYSDTLLLALLKRHDDGYKERVQVDAKTEHRGVVTHEHQHTADLEALYKSMNPEEREAWKLVLAALARAEVEKDGPTVH